MWLPPSEEGGGPPKAVEGEKKGAKEKDGRRSDKRSCIISPPVFCWHKKTAPSSEGAKYQINAAAPRAVGCGCLPLRREGDRRRWWRERRREQKKKMAEEAIKEVALSLPRSFAGAKRQPPRQRGRSIRLMRRRLMPLRRWRLAGSQRGCRGARPRPS